MNFELSTSFWIRSRAKRGIDIVGTLLALIILSPIFFATAFCVRIFIGTPVLFSQARPGRDGVIFNVRKFRSMSNSIDKNGELLPDHLRVTKFGLLLRSSSLDELPSLINVLYGEMSIVGPRPLKLDYLPLYSPRQARRHEARPGITGLAQINGRNNLSWKSRFDLDVRYVTEASLWLDIKIVMLTVGKVLRREGISSGRAVGTEPFTGNDLPLSTTNPPNVEVVKHPHSTA